MGKLPVLLKPRKVVSLLEQLEFKEVRQRGSHKPFRHADGGVTTVPFHPGRDISLSLLHQIARDIGLSVEELLAHGKAIGPPDALPDFPQLSTFVLLTAWKHLSPPPSSRPAIP